MSEICNSTIYDVSTVSNGRWNFFQKTSWTIRDGYSESANFALPNRGVYTLKRYTLRLSLAVVPRFDRIISVKREPDIFWFTIKIFWQIGFVPPRTRGSLCGERMDARRNCFDSTTRHHRFGSEGENPAKQSFSFVVDHTDCDVSLRSRPVLDNHLAGFVCTVWAGTRGNATTACH